MERNTPQLLTRLLLTGAALLLFTGCAAQRPALQSIEPEWSHHEGHEQVSSTNDETWDRFAARRAVDGSRSAQLTAQVKPDER